MKHYILETLDYLNQVNIDQCLDLLHSIFWSKTYLSDLNLPSVNMDSTSYSYGFFPKTKRPKQLAKSPKKPKTKDTFWKIWFKAEKVDGFRRVWIVFPVTSKSSRNKTIWVWLYPDPKHW